MQSFAHFVDGDEQLSGYKNVSMHICSREGRSKIIADL